MNGQKKGEQRNRMLGEIRKAGQYDKEEGDKLTKVLRRKSITLGPGKTKYGE